MSQPDTPDLHDEPLPAAPPMGDEGKPVQTNNGPLSDDGPQDLPQDHAAFTFGGDDE